MRCDLRSPLAAAPIALALVLLLSLPVLAAEPVSAAAPAGPEQAVTPAVQDETPAAEAGAAPPAPLTPMMQEIFAAWNAHTIAVEALERSLAGITDHRQALAIQREIEAARDGVEVAILRIQARYARQEGRLADAAAIDQAVTELTAPRPVGKAIERPARADGR